MFPSTKIVAFAFVAVMSLLILAPVKATPIALPPDLDERFGEMTLKRRVVQDHYRIWVPLPGTIADDYKPFNMTWQLHAHDQSKVDATLKALHDPKSPRYHKWLTQEEAHALTSVHPLGLRLVLDYVQCFGINREDIRIENAGRTVTFQITPYIANEMLAGDFRWFRTRHHPDTMRSARQFGTRVYGVPKRLIHHVAFITPGTEFTQHRRHGRVNRQLNSQQVKMIIANDLNVRRHLEYQEARAAQSFSTDGENLSPIAEILPAPAGPPLSSSLANCESAITPSCLRAMYHIPSDISTSNVSIATLNLRPYCSVDSDVQQGFAMLGNGIPADYLPQRIDINISGVTPTACGSSHIEPDGDLQIMVPLVYPMQVYNLQAPSDYDIGLYGSIASLGQNGYPRPDVVSVSYGRKEYNVDYDMAFCQMTDAIVAQGTTLLASSGDLGCQDVEYPALCPHWIAVGAVEIQDGSMYSASAIAADKTDGWSWLSSGGFSDTMVPAPSWQAKALFNYTEIYTDPDFATLQTSGYAATPDVSAQGRNFLFYLTPANGAEGLYLFAGTSAASPLVASMLGLVNGALRTAGKGTLGSPLAAFYANPGLFRDVVSGSNWNNVSYFYTSGQPWPATKGWDPTSGLGTPLFDRLLSYFLNQ